MLELLRLWQWLLKCLRLDCLRLQNWIFISLFSSDLIFFIFFTIIVALRYAQAIRRNWFFYWLRTLGWCYFFRTKVAVNMLLGEFQWPVRIIVNPAVEITAAVVATSFIVASNDFLISFLEFRFLAALKNLGSVQSEIQERTLKKCMVEFIASLALLLQTRDSLIN